MKKVCWETIFGRKLNIMLDDKKQIQVFPCGETQLCVFAIQAIKILRNKFLTCEEVMKSWRIKSFSREEGTLEIEKTRA